MEKKTMKILRSTRLRACKRRLMVACLDMNIQDTVLTCVFLILIALLVISLRNYRLHKLKDDEELSKAIGKSMELRHIIAFENDNDDRKERVSNICENSIGSRMPRRSIIDDPPSNFIVDWENKLLYCEVPKAACSSWKKFFFELRGINVTSGINGKARKLLTHLHELSITDRREVLQSFTKFMVARNPFSRVLSAYRNKIQPNGSYEKLNRRWQPYIWRENVGQHIIRQYRGNDVALEMMANKDKYDVTFTEFARFLGEFPDHPAAKDLHWREITNLCYPCDVKYDVIVKFEAMAKEIQMFFDKAGLKASTLPELNLHATNSSDVTQAIEYYRTLPRDVVRRLYERYFYDFVVFGYDADAFYPGITVNRMNYQLITIHG